MSLWWLLLIVPLCLVAGAITAFVVVVAHMVNHNWNAWP